MSAVLGWVALVSFTAPGQAQTTLLSNYANRHASARVPAQFGEVLRGESRRQDVSLRVSVYSRDSNGVPGSELYLLSGTVSAGKVTLTSPPNAVLAANTEYFVHFEDTHTSEPRGSYAIGLVDDADTDTALSGLATRINASRRVNRGLGAGKYSVSSAVYRMYGLSGVFTVGTNTPPTASDASVTTNKDSTVVQSTEQGLHRWHVRSRLVGRLYP